MGGNNPRFPSMAPDQHSKTLRESEDISWVPLKCKYLTLGSYHNITQADIVRCSEIYVKSRPKSLTLQHNQLIKQEPHKNVLENGNVLTRRRKNDSLSSTTSSSSGNSSLSNSCSIKDVIDEKDKPSTDANADLEQSTIKVETVQVATVHVETKVQRIQSISKTSFRANGTSQKTPVQKTTSNSISVSNGSKSSKSGRQKSTKKSQPMKNFCCCWSAPKTKKV